MNGQGITLWGIMFPAFKQCYLHYYVICRILDFKNAEVLIDVSLYGCRTAREQTSPPILPPPPPIPPPPSAIFNASVGLNGRNGSFIALQLPEDQVLER